MGVRDAVVEGGITNGTRSGVLAEKSSAVAGAV